jgi:LysM repeat protein
VAAVAVLAASSGAAEGRYTVKGGDSLWVIARRFGLSVNDLVAANGLARPDRIYAGSTIRIPGRGAASAGGAAPSATTTYKVKAGDNLSNVAARYHTTVAALLKANRIRSANLIVIGTQLTIPAGAASAASAGPDGAGRLPSRLLASPDRLALRPAFRHWAAVYGVPADLLQAMTWYESGWQNGVVSKTKAMGIGQLMPDTVVFVNQVLLGGTHLDPKRADDNIRMSARFLRYLLDRTGGRADQALAGYYQGLASVRARGQYDDTKQYVAGVLSFRPSFR